MSSSSLHIPLSAASSVFVLLLSVLALSVRLPTASAASALYFDTPDPLVTAINGLRGAPGRGEVPPLLFSAVSTLAPPTPPLPPAFPSAALGL